MATNEIRYKGVTYATDQDIWASTGTLYETKSLKCDSLEANTISVTVSDSDRSIMSFAKNDRVEYLRDGKLMGIYYLQSVERVGPVSYTLNAVSAVGLLMTRSHPGGVYTGETAEEVIRSICGDIPVLVESVYASRKIYNWLPYVQPPASSARDNLAEVLFVLGAWLGVDRDGVLRVEKLWDGYSCTIGPARIHAEGAAVQYTDPVSSVEVTEHQYVKSSDEVTLFDGTATEGTLVIFDAPAYDLVGSGVSVLESGANYAVLSAGTGTLKGKSYNHLTRTVSRTVTEGADENVITIQDAHLVSITNSVEISRRLAQYYSCRETIQVDTNPHAGPPGAVVQMWHPWDGQYVQTTIAQRDTVISGLLKSSTDALVGFLPPQPETAEYFDSIEVVTTSGEVSVGDGASATLVLIGGGDGGTGGAKGEDGTAADPASNPAGKGGAGGDPGTPGSGGKVLVVDIDTEDGGTFSISIGPGGVGGDKNGGEGAAGTATTLTYNGTTYTSADGSSNPDGYTDPIQGKIYALPGDDGTAGAKGGNGGSQTDGAMGGSVGDVLGGAGGKAYYSNNRYITGGGGGGASIDTPGGNGGDATVLSNGYGGAGADAQNAPSAQTNPGNGGNGGNGGGGGGGSGGKGSGWAPGGTGGSGSVGGKAANGCVLILRHKATLPQTGPLVTSDPKWLLDSLGRWMIV